MKILGSIFTFLSKATGLHYMLAAYTFQLRMITDPEKLIKELEVKLPPHWLVPLTPEEEENV